MSTGTREEESPSDIQSDSGSGTTADAVPGPPPAPEANTAPPSLDEAKVRRRKQKMREFRKYLVDTRVIDALLTLLVALWEAEERPSEPQEFFIDYFGEYRDPVLDEIDELKKLQEELSVSNKELQEKQKELCEQVLQASQQRGHQKLWKALAREAESITSLQIYQRLCEKKKPKSVLKMHVFNKPQFHRFLESFATEEWQSLLMAALYPQGEKAEFLATAPFKADPDNTAVLSFVEANNAYDPKVIDA